MDSVIDFRLMRTTVVNPRSNEEERQIRRERQRRTHACPRCWELGMQCCIPTAMVDSNTPRHGEILQYYRRNQHRPIEDPYLSKHYVILLPPSFKHARFSSNTDYHACAVVTSHPIGNAWGIDESRNTPYHTHPQALFQENSVEGGVHWVPFGWTLLSWVGVSSRTIHRSCLHALYELEWPGIRAKLDLDSFRRLTGAIHSTRRIS